MRLNEFIFSNGRRCRLARHLGFWLAWLYFSSFVQLIPAPPDSMGTYVIISNYIFKAITRLPFQVAFCYYIVYVFVPRYIIKKRFGLAVAYLFLSTLILFWLTYFFLTPIFSLLSIRTGGKPLTLFIRLFFSFYSNINFTGAIPACCFMLVIKYYKNWLVSEKENQVLLRENARAELQLLKAQVHPHFLFNTLNNIYSYSLRGDPYAADLVDKLSGMIDYMRMEGYRSLVSLGKEVRLLEDYIELEKVRHGSRLNLVVGIEGNFENKFVAPLLMIPFVENCFKHGVSKLRGHQWIRMFITVKDNQLHFSLANSKMENGTVAETRSGIGLTNVKKRLQLLYPGNHVLQIESGNESFSVNLQIELSEREMLADDELSIESSRTVGWVAYA